MKQMKHLVKEKMLLLIFLLPVPLWAQELPNVLLPSPQTQELNKYIDFPVDHSTGIPEISIPLYVIKTKGLEIPISLNYHASGIQHGQDDGNVGLGWSLSSDYRVSRTIYGHPDAGDVEMNPASYQTQMANFEANLDFPPAFPITMANRHLLYPFRDRDKYLRRFYHAVDLFNMMPIAGGLPLDGEYDHFYYRIPGQGGKFIISDRSTKTITEFSGSTNLFDYTEGLASDNIAEGIIGFTVKDEDQNMYSFGEQIDQLGLQVFETNYADLDRRHITAWALTDIDTKYGEKIKFNYDATINAGKYKRHLNIDLVEPVPNSSTLWEYIYDDESKRNSYYVFSLSSIETENEYIEFLNTDSSLPHRIQQINIKDVHTDALIKRVELYYHMEHFDIHHYMFLDSVKIFGQDLLEFQKYSFAYHNEDHYPPGFFTGQYLVPDAWGYNKLTDNAIRLLHTELGNDHARPPGSSYNSNRIAGILSERYPGIMHNRMANSSPELFSLRSVHYPTGGRTDYQYEPHSTASVPAVYRGGIRIKQISHYDRRIEEPSTEVLNLRRTFAYEGGSSPTYHTDHDEFRKEYGVLEISPLEGELGRRGVTYSSTKFGDQSDIDQRIHYAKVTERLTSTSGNLGRIVYQFLSSAPSYSHPYPVEHVHDGSMIHYPSSPTYVSRYLHWKKPLLFGQTTYAADGTMVKKERYVYTETDFQEFIGLKVRPNAVFRTMYDENFPWYYNLSSTIYNHGLYTLETGTQLLSNKTETLYRNGDSVLTSVSYEYNALHQVVKETTTDSRADNMEVVTSYPLEYASINPVASRMRAENDVGKILEQTTRRNGNMINNTKYEYQELPGDLFVLDRLKLRNMKTNLDEDGIIFHQYDELGNIQSLSQSNGVITNYIWSYNGQYPIAEITGVDFQAIETLLGGSLAIKNFNDLVNPTKSVIDSFLSPLRTAISTGTLTAVTVNSFSYDPILGVLSETDAAGKTTYYDYDAFGRLHLIRGTNQAIEQQIEYNHRNHGGL